MIDLDHFLIAADHALRTVFAPAATLRPVPGQDLPDVELSEAEKRHAAGLMRVNHAGEICAQALYEGQALTARDAGAREASWPAQAPQPEPERLGEAGSRRTRRRLAGRGYSGRNTRRFRARLQAGKRR